MPQRPATTLEVMEAAIEVISSSPGLDDSNGWVIVQADTQGGFVRAETDVNTPAGFLQRASTRSASPTVVVSAAGENRTQVIVQRTSGAEELAERSNRELHSEFGLN